MAEPTYSTELLNIADAVRLELVGATAGTFTLAFTPTLKPRLIVKLVDLSTLNVSVVPVSVMEKSLTRAANAYEQVLDVVILKNLTLVGGDVAVTEADSLMNLAEEIRAFLWTKPRLTAYTGAALIGTQFINGEPFQRDRLENLNEFQCILRLTYRTVR
ncbi:MAG: hypothetical protein IMZ65_03965 [Planctomycetes bacterium]|nr:hypothetical protein [Planctomycetota bacterium]